MHSDGPLTRQRISTRELVSLFVDGRSSATMRAYRSDLSDYARFTGADPASAVEALLKGVGPANELALRYRNELLQRGLKAASVNRRLSTLRSIVSFARTLGVVDYELAIRNLAAHAYRDTRGPGTDGVRQMLVALSRRNDAKGVRDTAIVRLLFDLALRCSEVISLDRKHVDLNAMTLMVLRKGRSDREVLSLPKPTGEALKKWLSIRGTTPGALFTNFDRAGKGQRLTSNGLYRVVRTLGLSIGRRVRPHGLRHAAVTAALDVTGGDVRKVAKFSSHRSIQTVLIYDDSRIDSAGEIAALVAGTL